MSAPMCFLPWCSDEPTHNLVGLPGMPVGTRHSVCLRHYQALVGVEMNFLTGQQGKIPGDRAEPTYGEAGMTTTTRAEPRFPHLGANVLYASRTGDYSLAATVARNCKSSSPEALHRGVEAGRLFMQPLGLLQVDLTVFTPGGSFVEGEPSQWTGTYAEHHIGYDPDGAPGTWRWFDDAVARGVVL